MNAHPGPIEASMPEGASTAGADAVYEFTFGTFNQTVPWTDRRSLRWDDLAKLLTTHGVGQKEGTCIVPAVFHGAVRKKADARRIGVAFLDSDSGSNLDEIAATVSEHGWRAIISSSHSHMTTRTKVKGSNWERYVAQQPAGVDPALLPAAYLREAKGYLGRVADGARIVGQEDEFVFFEHQPCPKFRIVIPLARAWQAADFPDQAKANKTWKERVEALAHALQLDHDQSCTDTSRLFYLPRRAPGSAPAEARVLDGVPCDIFALPSIDKGTEAKPQRARKKKPAEESGEFTDPETGEVVDLSRWARRYAARFEIVQALETRRPAAFLGKVADAVKHHIRCVNEYEHTNAGEDGATFVTNASGSSNKGFVYHCRHAHCTDRDRFFFLRKMLAEGWLKPEDLTDPRHLAPVAGDGHDAGVAEEPGSDAVEGRGFNALPVIQHVAGRLPEVVDQAEQALLNGKAGIFQRGAMLVRAGRVLVSVPKRGDVEALRILEVQAHTLVEEMTKVADWEKFDARAGEFLPITAPMQVAETYRQRTGRWKLRVLAGVITSPTLREDGSILATKGYDERSGLLLDLRGTAFPEVLECPTRNDADHALRTLKDLVATFPFVAEADRAVALSAFLTAVIRRSLRTAPLHAFSAPTAGSGKSLLVDTASMIATGREAGVISQGPDEKEMEKRLGAQLIAGDQLIAIDNCDEPLGGQILCQMLTQRTVRTRVLGKSETPEMPSNALITATGNNLVLMGDMTRRALLCRIDPKEERPELREFAVNPVEMVRADRGKYVHAALTILRAYHVAGRPQQAKPLGSFEDWSRWVRDALIWAGEADPAETMAQARASDPKLEELTEVLQHWKEHIGQGVEVTVRILIDRATAQRHAEGGGQEFKHPDFREALLRVAGKGGAINGMRLGKWLGANKGRVVDHVSIQPGTISEGSNTWKVAPQLGW